jgi:hypothetical protein
MRALREWRHYIQGSPHSTIVYSDHLNLTYFKSPQKIKPRQARWQLELAEYNIQLVHTPGTKMVQSDALSRRPDLCPEEEEPQTATVLPETLFINAI